MFCKTIPAGNAIYKTITNQVLFNSFDWEQMFLSMI